MRVFAWGRIVEWCAVPGSVILKHLLIGKGLWEQTWDWQVGFNSRDFVQLPKNHSPDAGAEHMLPDRNDVLGKRGSQQVSVRHWFWIQPCLSLSFSQHCLCISNWLAWRCTAFFPYAAPRKYLTRGKFPTYHLLLSLSLLSLCFFSAWDIFSELLIPLTHSFWKAHSYCSSSGTILFPRHWSSLPFYLSLLCWRSVPSLKAPKETASMHALKQIKAQPQTSHLLPFHSHPDQQVTRTSTVSRL